MGFTPSKKLFSPNPWVQLEFYKWGGSIIYKKKLMIPLQFPLGPRMNHLIWNWNHLIWNYKTGGSPPFLKLQKRWCKHIYIKPMIPLQFPPGPRMNHLIWNWNHLIWKTPHTPEKRSPWPPKRWKWGHKKKAFPESTIAWTFCKKPGLIWYIWASGASFLIYTPYRGSPPCAIFHNPDNREI